MADTTTTPTKNLILFAGSAWGLGLFQSPYDFHRLEELNEEAGIPQLARRAVLKAIADGVSMPMEMRPRGLWCDPEYGIRYSLFADECTDIAAVRAHMDTGVLAKMLENWQQKPESKSFRDGPEPRYNLVLLGACAMTLGCKLPSGFKEIMSEELRKPELGFQRHAVQQLLRAVHPDTGYHDGRLFDFAIKSKAQVFADGGVPVEDRLLPDSVMVDCMSPHGMPAPPKEIVEKGLEMGLESLAHVQAEVFNNLSAADGAPKTGMSPAGNSANSADNTNSGAIHDTETTPPFGDSPLWHQMFKEFSNCIIREIMAAKGGPTGGDKPILPKKCGGCWVEAEKAKLQVCGRCKKDAYCSKKCQKWHWKEHKVQCNDNPKVSELVFTKFPWESDQ